MSTPFPEYRVVQQATIEQSRSSSPVELWTSTKTNKIYAVKRALMAHREGHHCCSYELISLQIAKGVPRVVQLYEARLSGGYVFFIMEFVQGVTLEVTGTKWAQQRIHSLQRESNTLEVAAQLIDTLEYLHVKTGLVHLDISSRNLMLHCYESCKGLTFVDLGHSRPVEPGERFYPTGLTIAFACPETLSCQMQGSEAEPIDPKAADVWSSGVVLFQLLTNRLPFTTQNDIGFVLQAPDHLHTPEQRTLWECNETWQAQLSWANAVAMAELSGEPIRHPIADMLVAASTAPQQAIDFFKSVLQADPARRFTASQAANHPYLQDAMAQINRDWLATLPPPLAPDQASAVTGNTLASEAKSQQPVASATGSGGDNLHAALPSLSVHSQYPAQDLDVQPLCDSASSMHYLDSYAGTSSQAKSAPSASPQHPSSCNPASMPTKKEKKGWRGRAMGALKHLGQSIVHGPRISEPHTCDVGLKSLTQHVTTSDLYRVAKHYRAVQHQVVPAASAFSSSAWQQQAQQHTVDSTPLHAPSVTQRAALSGHVSTRQPSQPVLPTKPVSVKHRQAASSIPTADSDFVACDTHSNAQQSQAPEPSDSGLPVPITHSNARPSLALKIVDPPHALSTTPSNAQQPMMPTSSDPSLSLPPPGCAAQVSQASAAVDTLHTPAMNLNSAQQPQAPAPPGLTRRAINRAVRVKKVKPAQRLAQLMAEAARKRAAIAGNSSAQPDKPAPEVLETAAEHSKQQQSAQPDKPASEVLKTAAVHSKQQESAQTSDSHLIAAAAVADRKAQQGSKLDLSPARDSRLVQLTADCTSQSVNSCPDIHAEGVPPVPRAVARTAVSTAQTLASSAVTKPAAVEQFADVQAAAAVPGSKSPADANFDTASTLQAQQAAMPAVGGATVLKAVSCKNNTTDRRPNGRRGWRQALVGGLLLGVAAGLAGLLSRH